MLEQIIGPGLFLLSILGTSLINAYADNPTDKSDPTLLIRGGKQNKSIQATKRKLVLALFLKTVSISAFTIFVLWCSYTFSLYAAAGLIILSLVYVFIFLPQKSSGRLAKAFASWLAPVFIYVLEKTSRLTGKLELFLLQQQKSRKVKLLSKKELTDLIKDQRSMPEGSLLSQDLTLTLNALELSGKNTRSLMIPMKSTHLVSDKEPVGPILIAELHKSSRKIFLVENKKIGLVGTVSLESLLAMAAGGSVGKALESGLAYADENDNIFDLLEKFIQTGKLVLVVTDSGKENLGAIYLEDIIKILIREPGSAKQNNQINI